MTRPWISTWLGGKPPQDKPEAGAHPAAAPDAAVLQAAAQPMLAIVASAVRVRAASSAEQLAEALASNSARCELDPELTDDLGYPILSGRIDELDESPVVEAMSDWLAVQGMADLTFSDEQWRALALGSAVVTELAGYLTMHELLPDFAEAEPAARAKHPLPHVQLRTLLPDSWVSKQRDATQEWFRHLVEQQGWPAQRIGLGPGATELLGHLAMPAGGLALLVACESLIGEDSLSELSDGRALFTSSNARGTIPGEGAAALLLADPAQAGQIPAVGRASLAALAHGRRTISADAPANVNADLLVQLAKDALAASATEASAIAMVSGDADLHASRVGELMGMTSTVLPELLQETQMLSVGSCCGDAGAAGTLAALVLAAHAASASGGPVLCVSNADAVRRWAMVLKPA